MNISVGEVVLPNKPLSNIELLDSARELKIPICAIRYRKDRTRKNEEF